MNINIPSYLIGAFFLLVGFLACLLAVVGVKAIYLAVKNKFFKEPPPPEPKPQPKKPRPKTPKTVRSIEIDPEQIDRIYVKKIS